MPRTVGYPTYTICSIRDSLQNCSASEAPPRGAPLLQLFLTRFQQTRQNLVEKAVSKALTGAEREVPTDCTIVGQVRRAVPNDRAGACHRTILADQP